MMTPCQEYWKTKIGEKEMSYIRSPSNPERLYVFDCWWNEDNESVRIVCDRKDFKQFIRKIVKQNGYIPDLKPVVHKNIIPIQEVTVSYQDDTRRIFRSELRFEDVEDIEKYELGLELRYCLKIGSKKILLWPVT